MNSLKLQTFFVIGFLAGIFPDIDIFFRSNHDPLLFLEYHRQFTHSLIFIPIGGFIFTTIFYGLFYKLIPFSDDLDLSEFYQTAKERGFVNNADRHMLVETIAKEDEWQVWMLLYNNKIVGSTAAHSFPEMGPDSYRIAVRTCAFTDMMPIHRVRTVTGIIESPR